MSNSSTTSARQFRDGIFYFSIGKGDNGHFLDWKFPTHFFSLSRENQNGFAERVYYAGGNEGLEFVGRKIQSARQSGSQRVRTKDVVAWNRAVKDVDRTVRPETYQWGPAPTLTSTPSEWGIKRDTLSYVAELVTSGCFASTLDSVSANPADTQALETMFALVTITNIDHR